MSRAAQFVVAGVLAVVGLLVLVAFAFSGAGSVREHIAERYQRVDSSDPALAGALVYTSNRNASQVASDIASAWKPADRHADPAGYFLRYRNDIVVVAPYEGGSRITVDDEDRGYARWYPFVGGYWGTYTATGEDVRGGGPGAGK